MPPFLYAFISRDMPQVRRDTRDVNTFEQAELARCLLQRATIYRLALFEHEAELMPRRH